MRPASLLVLLAVLFQAPPAAAQELAVGQVHHGPLVWAGKQIPLPAGAWLLAGLGAGEPPTGAPGPVGAVGSAVLLAEAEGRVTGFVLAYTNLVPGDGGWGAADDCARDDLHLAERIYDTPLFRSCAWVGHALGNDGGDPAWVAARGLIERRGWRLPAAWLVAGLRLSDPRDVVEVRYYFNPEAEGVPPDDQAAWAAHPWSAARVGADPRRAAMVAEVVSFARAMRRPLAEGFKNRLPPGASPAMPWSGAPPPPAEAAPAAGPPVWQLSAIKTVTLTVLQQVNHYLVNWLFVGDPVSAAGLSAAHAVVHPAINFSHEYFFASGAAARTVAPGSARSAVTAFSAVGVTG